MRNQEKRNLIRAYLHKIGNKICATFDDGGFSICETEDCNQKLLKEVGSVEADLPCYVEVNRQIKEVSQIVHGY